MSRILVIPAGLRKGETWCIGPGLCLLHSPDSDLRSGHNVCFFHDRLFRVPDLGLEERGVALLSEGEKE